MYALRVVKRLLRNWETGKVKQAELALSWLDLQVSKLKFTRNSVDASSCSEAHQIMELGLEERLIIAQKGTMPYSHV